MSNLEPVNFLRERKRRRPGEQAPIEQESQRPTSVQQERPLAPTPHPEPEVRHKLEPEKGPRCSCCELPAEKVRVFLDMGNGVLLCGGCIQVCNEILCEEEVTTDAVPAEAATSRFSHSNYRTTYRCSFCGKDQAQVARLIAMLHDLFICNSCVGRCNAGMAQALPDAPAEAKDVVRQV